MDFDSSDIDEDSLPSYDVPLSVRWYQEERLKLSGGDAGRGLSSASERRFYSLVSLGLCGRWIHTESHACGLRMYLGYRELERSFGRPGSLPSFAAACGISVHRMHRWLRGRLRLGKGELAGGYSLDVVHQWASHLTSYWEVEGISVVIVSYADGVSEPVFVYPDEF